MIVGKRFHFDAAHYLPNHPTCGKLHGHTWIVDVELESEVLDKNGMVFDFNRLKGMMESILKNFDHCNLNDFIHCPTCEVIAASIGASLKTRFEATKLITAKLYSVKVQEGVGGYAIHRVD